MPGTAIEALYKEMEASFAEAVRIFAKQSIQENHLHKRPAKLALSH